MAKSIVSPVIIKSKQQNTAPKDVKKPVNLITVGTVTQVTYFLCTTQQTIFPKNICFGRKTNPCIHHTSLYTCCIIKDKLFNPTKPKTHSRVS